MAAGNPGLATSGSGGVQAGAVAGFLTRKAAPAQAACWATYLHATAGDRLAAAAGPVSFLARELLDAMSNGRKAEGTGRTNRVAATRQNEIDADADIQALGSQQRSFRYENSASYKYGAGYKLSASYKHSEMAYLTRTGPRDRVPKSKAGQPAIELGSESCLTSRLTITPKRLPRASRKSARKNGQKTARMPLRMPWPTLRSTSGSLTRFCAPAPEMIRAAGFFRSDLTPASVGAGEPVWAVATTSRLAEMLCSSLSLAHRRATNSPSPLMPRQFSPP